MLVYRIEHKDFKYGPYTLAFTCKVPDKQRLETSALAHSLLSAHGGGSTSHPGVTKILGWTREHLCGFTSMNQLETWFAGFLEPLFKCGFVIKIYDVDESDIVSDGKQCAFIPRDNNGNQQRNSERCTSCCH